MTDIKINPFNITKAVDYSDEEINNYWVDISGGNGFIDMVKPLSPMPVFLLGGKGSGKTHIMRYFSYNLQKIRHKEDLLQQISNDRYIGIYLRCSGLNSSRFKGGIYRQGAWKNIFSYYIELWFTQLLVNIVFDLNDTHKNVLLKYENSICKKLYALFDRDVSKEFDTLKSFSDFLQKRQKQVDYDVNNSVITGQDINEADILVTPGRLIFGFPGILESVIKEFKGIQFIYLVDEFENLEEYQQRYINTLIRERESPVSFRVGVRWYGIKTWNTFSGNEDLKVGSEIEKYVIDIFLRNNNSEFEKYAKEICLSRLKQSGFSLSKLGSSKNSLSSYFEEFDLDKFFKKLNGKEEKHSKSYLFKLEESLKKQKAAHIESIINNLKYDKNPLLERTNVMIFYREWKAGADLRKASETIKSDCLLYVSDSSNKNLAHYKVLDKFKYDLIDQLHREARETLSYSGIDKIIKMSAGIPRFFLMMLKHIYRWSIYAEENPFSGGVISEKSQMNGLGDASKWFLEDARAAGIDGKLMSTSISKIGQYMQEIRFSNIPSESSLSSFSIKMIDIDEGIEKTLSYLEQYSYLIKVNPTREKNSITQRVTYQINGLLSPHWELPIYRRGILHLTSDEVAVIFKNCTELEYNSVKNLRLATYNAPFRNLTTPTLF
ncbi:hypothetical protein [Mucilaginibacter sp. PAMB04168]|uniref:ORC-CDC6 family AAA ATPase n=1 Tax=Mucilaginibacter sp. PAMB04168 TaxID=3138567 RepID=UPI0031F65758